MNVKIFEKKHAFVFQQKIKTNNKIYYAFVHVATDLLFLSSILLCFLKVTMVIMAAFYVEFLNISPVKKDPLRTLY